MRQPPSGRDDSGQTWLQLLVVETSANAIAAHLETLQSRTSDPEVRRFHEAEAARALQLRSMLAEQRVRATELTVLNHIAGQLTALHDIDDLLQEVINQTHLLLSSDIAYLSLFDDDGDLHVAVTAGAMSPRLSGLRIIPEAGVAGKIIASGTAAWTTDYLADVSFPHDTDTDEAVSVEGIRSLLGVPLKLRGKVIGILFVGFRKPRHFSDDQVTLLAALGSHAAVAIANARLFEAASQSATEYADANKRLMRQSEELDLAAALHQRLIEIVLAGGGADEVARGLADDMGVDVEYRPQAKLVAAPAVGGATAKVPGLGPTDAHPAPQQGRSRVHQLPDHEKWATETSVASGRENLGSLLMLTDHPPTIGQVQELERGALVIALTLMTDRAVRDASMRIQGEFLIHLLTYPQDDDLHLDSRIGRAPIDLAADQTVIVFAYDSAHIHANRMAAATLAQQWGGVAAEHLGYSVVVVPCSEPQALLRGVQSLLATSVPPSESATVSVSGPAVGATAISDHFVKASRSIALMVAMGRNRCVALSSDLSGYQFLFSGLGRGEALEFVTRTLGPLLDHDQLRGSDLIQTIDVYFKNRQRPKPTAEALHVHINTLYQRLEKIEMLLGGDWLGPDRTLDIQLAIRIHQLSQGLGDLL